MSSFMLDQVIPGVIFVLVVATGIGLALGPHTDDINPAPSDEDDHGPQD